MIIEFKNITKAGNNHRSEMYFDAIFVANIQCTPKEFEVFLDFIEIGIDTTTTEDNNLHKVIVHAK